MGIIMLTIYYDIDVDKMIVYKKVAINIFSDIMM